MIPEPGSHQTNDVNFRQFLGAEKYTKPIFLSLACIVSGHQSLTCQTQSSPLLLYFSKITSTRYFALTGSSTRLFPLKRWNWQTTSLTRCEKYVNMRVNQMMMINYDLGKGAKKAEKLNKCKYVYVCVRQKLLNVSFFSPQQ